MLRPRPARWFEILAARDDATLVLEALARTGAVELEARAGAALPPAWAEVAPLLARLAELAARYRAWWPPAARCRPSAFPEAPQQALQRSLDAIRAWAVPAEPLILTLQRDAAERAEIALWEPVLAALHARGVDPATLAHAGPLVQVALLRLPRGAEALRPEGPTLLAAFEIDAAPHALVAGTPRALQSLAQAATALHGSVHPVPDWLVADAAANAARIARRRAELDAADAAARAALAEATDRHDLPRALGDAWRLQWLMHNVHQLEADEWLCWITGWCTDADALAAALEACAARALLHFAAAPPGAQPPLQLANPPWARPFELFSRALGMPASTEADPSELLAVAVPLLFGYMFGDVGQGLVLAAGACYFRRRSPIARLLMVGGLSAALFGLLFGSVFGLHGLLPALWLHPLDSPLQLLAAPLIGGALLLTLGLGLDALAALWRREWQRWLLTDASLVFVYLALLAALADRRALALAAAAALAYCLGHAVEQRRALAALAAVGGLAEKTLQLLINTLSFARVGAFALAHAGLSSALVALTDAAASPLAKGLVLVLGNVLIILIEAMVVSIQTTRLVLFEFFNRFMQGQGREFRPLPLPPSCLPLAQEN